MMRTPRHVIFATIVSRKAGYVALARTDAGTLGLAAAAVQTGEALTDAAERAIKSTFGVKAREIHLLKDGWASNGSHLPAASVCIARQWEGLIAHDVWYAPTRLAEIDGAHEASAAIRIAAWIAEHHPPDAREATHALCTEMVRTGSWEVAVTIGVRWRAGNPVETRQWCTYDTTICSHDPLAKAEPERHVPRTDEARLETMARDAAGTLASTHLACDAWYTRGQVTFTRNRALEGTRGPDVDVHLSVAGPAPKRVTAPRARTSR